MKKSYKFDIDGKLRIKLWGREMQELTGRPPAAALGKKYYEALPRAYIGNRDAALQALRSKKPVKIKDYCCTHLNGQVLASLTITPRRAGSGKPDGARFSICPGRMCPVARRLQNSQRLIDIGKMASILAHGVRNPLNAIKGAVVYIGEKYSDEATVLEFMKIMEEEISRLDNFISGFLSASIQDMGPDSDINALVKKIEVYTSFQAQARNIKCEYIYGLTPPARAKNSFQLEQAILNVVNNAIEAMPSGGVLSVRTLAEKKTPSGDEWIIVEVSDTGPGMNTESDDGRKSPPAADGRSGRGFGLFITREILQYCGGRLEIGSKKGLGTTVRLCMPALSPEL